MEYMKMVPTPKVISSSTL